MKITKVKCIDVLDKEKKLLRVEDFPYTSSFYGRSRTIVKITTDKGIEGCSVSPGMNSEFIAKALGPLLIGEDPFLVKKLWEKMYSSYLVWDKNVTIIRNTLYPAPWQDITTSGAIAALDIALYDLIGKTVGQPIYRILGGYKDKILAYADGENNPDIEPLEKSYKRYVEHGYKVIKTHIQPYYGENPVERVAKQVKMIREAIGEDVLLAVDFYNKYTPEIAIEAALAIEKYHPFWIEDPTYSDNYIDGLSMVRSAVRGRINIAGGEEFRTLYNIKKLFEGGAVDILNLYPWGVGGITPWIKVAALAEAYNVRVNTYGGVALEVQSHLIAATPNGLAVDTLPIFCPVYGGVRWPELYIKPVEPKDGYIEMSREPGLGIELNEKEIEKYKVAEY